MSVTDRPILFSGEMVRAILDRRKTQTRRVIKPQPYVDANGNACWKNSNFGQDLKRTPLFKSLASPIPCSSTKRVLCPYGAPGDQLWVRETWGHTGTGVWSVGQVYYAQDGGIIYRADHPNAAGSWFSPLHMPRFASRITLRITDIRVERLQDISEDDARAEGVGYKNPGYLPGTKGNWIGSFAYLWNKINGPGAWNTNPWVWVVAFERVKP